MAHDPKIEVYKLILNRKGNAPKTFREFFRSKSNHYQEIQPPPATDGEILGVFLKDFTNSIGLQAYKTDANKKKGFTVAVEENEGVPKTLIEFSSEEMFIDGFFYGGKYNAERFLGKINDTGSKSKINRDNIVSDQFYFLLYTPLNHREGIIIIQGYSEGKISDIVRRHLKGYFKYTSEWTSRTEVFIPKKYREDYKKDAKFQKVVFTSSWNISEHDYEDITGKQEHTIEVKIELQDNSLNKPSAKSIKSLVGWFGKSMFKMKNGTEKHLEDFDTKTAKMESKGKVLTFDFDDEDNIRPLITLPETEFLTQTNSLNFDAVKQFCRNLLAEIKEEISPQNGVQEL